ncbi:MAG: hypothetical protein AAGE89_18495, partial [Pseudomonadota bacterium]
LKQRKNEKQVGQPESQPTCQNCSPVHLRLLGLSGRCVSTDPASDLISFCVSDLGSFRPLLAIFPTFEPDFSFFAIVSASHQASRPAFDWFSRQVRGDLRGC